MNAISQMVAWIMEHPRSFTVSHAGEKFCKGCKLWHAATAENFSVYSGGALAPLCKPCMVKKVQRWRKEHNGKL